ncbi:MAG: hypothetical protein C0506_16830 [Anaerolinea sp.]|nr:hypothetical protein [Anaerolinea sp.]
MPRGASMVLEYRPRRRRRPRCGVHMEALPWTEPWSGVTWALAGAVVALARDLSWQETAHSYGINWKSVACLQRTAVGHGLAERRQQPLPDWR